MKRQASAAAGAAAKRRAASIASTIQSADAEWLTASRASLLASISGSLSVYKDQRPPQQQKMVEMIGHAIDERVAGLQKKVDDAKVPVDGAESEKEARAKGVGDAKTALEALEGTIEEKKTALDEAIAHEAATKKALQEREGQAKTAEKMYDAMVDMKAKFDVMQSAFQIAEAAKVSGNSPAHKVPRTFLKIGKELGLEMKMIDTLPDVLAKEPAKRSEFERFIMTKFGEALNGLASVYSEATVEKGKTEKEDRAASVSAAKEELANATKAKSDSTGELADAKAAAKAGKAPVAQAQKVLDTYGSDMKVASGRYKDALAALSRFKDGTVASFEELKDHETPKED